METAEFTFNWFRVIVAVFVGLGVLGTSSYIRPRRRSVKSHDGSTWPPC